MNKSINILTTTFYADFARYFNYLEENFEKIVSNVKFYNISIYPSAHFQWKKYQKHSILLPSYVLNHKKNLQDIPINYKGINLDEIISFSYKTQMMFNRNHSKELKQQAIRYIDYFEDLFKNNRFDLYISSGDSRMLIQIADHFAKKNNVKIFYFEQGPFGTTMFDEKGVNCNISFMDRKVLDTDIDIKKLYEYLEKYYTEKPKKFWTTEKVNFVQKSVYYMTFLWMYPPKFLFSYFPIDTQLGSSFLDNMKILIMKKFKKKPKTNIVNNDMPHNAITFIMQVPVDAQLIENSPLYSNFEEMLKDIYQAIPIGYNLVVREHPGNIGRYSDDLYNFIKMHDNIYLINDISLKDTIVKSKLIILNNSTVGIEALSFGKTVITLGNAYYNRKDITYNLRDKTELKALIEYALDNPIAKEDIDVLLYNFIFNYLYIGHFQDEDLQSGEIIVNRMLNRIPN